MNLTDTYLFDRIMLATLAGLLLLASLVTPQVRQAEPATAVHNPAVREASASPERATTILPNKDAPASLPDFSAYENVQAKKSAFFNYLLPKVRAANDRIRADRRTLRHISASLVAGQPLNRQERASLNRLRQQYRVTAVEPVEATRQLLLRVDVVPESLVLAQAANESGWGTSRFARKANNLFGVWCFTKGCGLTPLRRSEGLTHEVARYDSVAESIAAYMRTINTHNAYRELRHIRAESRIQAEQMCGETLAEGLLRYSERGEDYVREIQQMIRVNNLQKYTAHPLRA